jgi:hypothetical protein
MRRKQKKNGTSLFNYDRIYRCEESGRTPEAGPATPRVSSGTITKLGSMYIEAIPAAVVADVTIVMGDPIVAVAMEGGATNSDVSLFSFIFPKSEYSTKVVCEA